MIDPASETAVVHRLLKAPEELTGFDRLLPGEDVLPGFELDLRELR